MNMDALHYDAYDDWSDSNIADDEYQDSSETESNLDFRGANILEPEVTRGTPSIALPNQDADYVTHIALDIGGSLIKLVYFSPDQHDSGELGSMSPESSSGELGNCSDSSSNGSSRGNHGKGGRLHFVKFETNRVEDAIAFIEAKGLHRYRTKSGSREMRVKATGGGAYKYAEIFKQRLGVVLETDDEMQCLVSGCNFLLRAISAEAFTFESGTPTFVPANADSDLFPYLLVNIGSGVSILKVDGPDSYQRVSGSSLGGGTFWGLCRLLTRVQDFDQLLELTARGNNANVDMLVGDIYGGRDYESIGLSASTIASSFGKVVSNAAELEDYDPADICLALCRMVAYNIGQLAYMNAMKYGLTRVFFGGFFIRNHPYTMETISFAIRFWSKGAMKAMFLRHEGFLGAVGAFLKVHPISGSPAGGAAGSSCAREQRKVRAKFKERFVMGAPFAGNQVRGPAIKDMSDRVDWVEKFVQIGAAATSPAASEAAETGSTGGDAAGSTPRGSAASPLPTPSETPSSSATNPLADLLDLTLAPQQHQQGQQLGKSLSSGLEVPDSPTVAGSSRMDLHVGVLQYTPSLEPFPLLADTAGYEPNTLNINEDEAEFHWWIKILTDQTPTVVEKAAGSEGNTAQAKRRAAAFGAAFRAHMAKLRDSPGAYGQLGLFELLELREECLREFGFRDVYRNEKDRENAAALEVLPDLLRELDAMDPKPRLLSLVEGVLAANIFDWGAKACVQLYQAGTILDIYRDARRKLSRRPWRVDQFDSFCERVLGGTPGRPPFRRVLMFVDNAGADIVLGMLPFAREFLRLGCEVVLAANSQPAINDITAEELRRLLGVACEKCELLRSAREAALAEVERQGGKVPPFGGLPRRQASSSTLAAAGPGRPAAAQQQQCAAAAVPRLYVVPNGHGSPCLDLRRVPDVLADAAQGVDLLVIEGMGRAVHTNFSTRFRCDVLKLAMIKTERLARKLFQGNLYDCICMFDSGVRA